MPRSKSGQWSSWRVIRASFLLLTYTPSSVCRDDSALEQPSTSEWSSAAARLPIPGLIGPQWPVVDPGSLGSDLQRPLAGNPQPVGELSDLIEAMKVMQEQYFEVWQGTWPQAIDWTAAVFGTHIAAALNSITRSEEFDAGNREVSRAGENLINAYFSHVSGFYYGQDAFSLRTQANDDMLWVVLGWLEGIRLINTHSDLHFPGHAKGANSTWYAKHFIAPFAHRARVFWDLASQGWDTKLCGGGMVWSPYLTPYKNAITNQLFIAASATMYLYFPGDKNPWPWSVAPADAGTNTKDPGEKHDPMYLDAALDAYKWLMGSNMTNSQGLFIDGFHVTGWRPDSNGSRACNIRDEKVYTYNQGVILTGQRALWEATGESSYLEDGHRLVGAVLKATGWPIAASDADADDDSSRRSRFKWAGLGRYGVLEEACDHNGTCSQNGQIFKGIFFHHLAAFCAPLPVSSRNDDDDDDGVFHRADRFLASLHRHSCGEYAEWVAHNARAALGTRDRDGRFGTWWTPGLRHADDILRDASPPPRETNATDYRNQGVPDTALWRRPESASWLASRAGRAMSPVRPSLRDESAERDQEDPRRPRRDPNERGRGRTVETQSAGLAVLRALYDLLVQGR